MNELKDIVVVDVIIIHITIIVIFSCLDEMKGLDKFLDIFTYINVKCVNICCSGPLRNICIRSYWRNS